MVSFQIQLNLVYIKQTCATYSVYGSSYSLRVVYSTLHVTSDPGTNSSVDSLTHPSPYTLINVNKFEIHGLINK